MKKILAILMAAALSLSVFAFAACGNDVGVISGNYKEATAEEAVEELEKVELSGLFGDVTASDWSFGLALTAEQSASVSGKADGDSVTASESAAAEYKMVVSKTSTGVDVKGAGEASFSYVYSIPASFSEGEVAEEGEFEFETNVYNDANNAYFTYDDTNYYMEMGLGGMITYALTMFSAGTVDMSDLDYDAEDIAALMEQYNMTLSMDASSGLKLKLSASEDTFKEYIDQWVSEMTEGYGYNVTYELNTATLDVYFAIDANGQFSGFGVNYNVNATVNIAFSDSGKTHSGSFTLKSSGGIMLSAYTGTVTLPSLTDYTTEFEM